MGQITGKQSDTKEYMRSSEKETTPSSEAPQDTLATGLVPGTQVDSNYPRERMKQLSVWERSMQSS